MPFSTIFRDAILPPPMGIRSSNLNNRIIFYLVSTVIHNTRRKACYQTWGVKCLEIPPSKHPLSWVNCTVPLTCICLTGHSDIAPELEYFCYPADSKAAVLRQVHRHQQGMRLYSEDVHPWEKVIKARLGIGGDLRRLQADSGHSGHWEAVFPFPLHQHQPYTLPPTLVHCSTSWCSSALAAAPCPKALFTLSASCSPRSSGALVTSAHIKPARVAFGAHYRKVTMSAWRTRPRLHVIKKL